jgi:hypothetical protein
VWESLGAPPVPPREAKKEREAIPPPRRESRPMLDDK